MKIRRILFLPLLCFLSFPFHAQTVEQFIPIFEDRRADIAFIEGKTLVTEIEFTGLDADLEEYGVEIENAAYESDFRQRWREVKQALKEGEAFSALKVHTLQKILKFWLSRRNYPHATVTALGQKLSGDRMRIRLLIDRGPLVTKVAVQFAGNSAVSSSELLEDFNSCGEYIGKNFELRYYEYIARRCSVSFMRSKGFWQSSVVDVTDKVGRDQREVLVTLHEGKRYRIGSITVEGNRVVPTRDILELLGQKVGDVADGKAFHSVLFEKLKARYDELGYVQYDAEADPKFIPPAAPELDGTVNVLVTISEGRQFKVRRVDFYGVSEDERKTLVSQFELKSGDVYSVPVAKRSIDKLNSSGLFSHVDSDKDVELLTDEKAGDIAVLVKLRAR